MSLLKAIGSGVAGATAVTLLNESGRRVIPHAPRMDVIGKRALARSMEAVGVEPPRRRELYQAAMLGDLLSNGLYYSLAGIGRGRNVWRRGLVLGLLAGVGAAVLPPYMRLGRQPRQRTPWTQLMTIALYVLGGLAAAGAARATED